MNDKIICDIKMRVVRHESIVLSIHINCDDYDWLISKLDEYAQEYEILSIWINNYNVESENKMIELTQRIEKVKDNEGI